METLDQVRNQDPVPPRRLNGRLPRDLETICLTCLDKAPDRRYQTAEALAGDLGFWLDGRPIMARPVSPLGHACRWCRRHPAVAGLLATLTITLITGLVALFVLLKQAAAERTRSVEARRNAEAYEQFASSAVDQLGGYLQATILNRSGTAPDQVDAALLKLRSSTNDLKRRGIVPSSTLGILELEIGNALMISSKADEARDLLNQAAEDLKQCLAKTPGDKEVRTCLSQALFLSGCLLRDAGQLDAALSCFEQSAVVQMDSRSSDPEHSILTEVYKRLQVLADRLGQSGRREQADHARYLSQQILRHLLGSDFASLADTCSLQPATLRRLFDRSSRMQMASHENGTIPRSDERFVAEWLALSVAPLSPFRSSSFAAAFDRDPEAGAGALIAAVRDRCSKLGLADSMVPAAINIVREGAAESAAEQRRLGRLDHARAAAARFMSIAQRLVREYPSSALSYRVLSEAHDQVKKNAFKTNDDALIVEALGQAVEAARRSLALDPDRLETRNYLEKLTEQLASVKADQQATVSSLP